MFNFPRARRLSRRRRLFLLVAAALTCTLTVNCMPRVPSRLHGTRTGRRAAKTSRCRRHCRRRCRRRCCCCLTPAALVIIVIIIEANYNNIHRPVTQAPPRTNPTGSPRRSSITRRRRPIRLRRRGAGAGARFALFCRPANSFTGKRLRGRGQSSSLAARLTCACQRICFSHYVAAGAS